MSEQTFKVGDRVQSIRFGGKGDVRFVSKDGAGIHVTVWGGRNGDQRIILKERAKNWTKL